MSKKQVKKVGGAIEGNTNDEFPAEDDDSSEEDMFRDPPPNHVRIRPSSFLGIPSTIFIEYPPEIKIKRNDISIVEPLGKRKLLYKSYWERICIRNVFRRAGFVKVDNDSSNVKWTAMWSKHQNEVQMKELNCLQKINHFPDSWCVGRKDRLYRTLNAMKRIHHDEYDFHPETFILPQERDILHRKIYNDIEHGKLKITANSDESDISNRIDRLSMWIIKPCASSCGRGIKVLNGQQVVQLGKQKSAIVQRYLINPYLIKGKKFDLRIYILVTGVDPLRIYIHQEGLTRISTSSYNLKNIKNRFAHLTNYSVNKKSKVFKAASMPSTAENEGDDGLDTSVDSTLNNDTEAEREGFKWSLSAFKRWLSEVESTEIMENTFRKIHDLCIKTMIAAESEITPSLHSKANYRTNCFELFGLDVILDSNLTPHLLEVNVSPSLTGSSPLDRKIKGMLIADIMHIVGLYCYDKENLNKYNETASPNNNVVNPFTFASLSSMMSEQDQWRRNPVPTTVNIRNISNGPSSSNSNDSSWILLLMIEDEFNRMKSTKFQCLHPIPTTCVHYNRLYRNHRFADHLLAKWVLDGMSTGINRQYIPSKFLTSDTSISATSKAKRTNKTVIRPKSASALCTSSKNNSPIISNDDSNHHFIETPVSETSNIGSPLETEENSLCIAMKLLKSPETKFSQYLYERQKYAKDEIKKELISNEDVSKATKHLATSSRIIDTIGSQRRLLLHQNAKVKSAKFQSILPVIPNLSSPRSNVSPILTSRSTKISTATLAKHSKV